MKKVEDKYHHRLSGVQFISEREDVYMCKYMFVQAVSPTTVEPDLMFVSVVRFLLLKINWSCDL